jgi:Right handed beta helix region
VLSRSEVTAPGWTCITVRSAARRIVLRRLRVHDCANGLGGGGGAPISRHVALLHSRLRRFTGDAVQFGRWDDVRIEGNRITDVQDPAGVIHNDAVQFTGDSHHVRIVDNELARSGQLLFIQDALGPIDDVLVRGNLIHDSAAYAIQSQGATDVRFTDNTVWHSRYGGLLIRQGLQTLPGGGHRRPSDTVVEGNILSGLEVDPYANILRNRWNIIRCGFPGAGRPCATDASFAAGYHLRRSAPLGRLAVGPMRLRAVRNAPRPGWRTSGGVPVRDRTD